MNTRVKSKEEECLTYLGLGSNLGDREKNLLLAVRKIGGSCTLLRHSSIYMTSPVGYTDQPDFLNMVVEVDSHGIDPYRLLDFVKGIEREMGRKKTRRWGPRIIDIDILFMSGKTVVSDTLQIPHREMFNRRFVLIPLSEITRTLPGYDKPIRATGDSLEAEGEDEKVLLYRPGKELNLHAGV